MGQLHTASPPGIVRGTMNVHNGRAKFNLVRSTPAYFPTSRPRAGKPQGIQKEWGEGWSLSSESRSVIHYLMGIAGRHRNVDFDIKGRPRGTYSSGACPSQSATTTTRHSREATKQLAQPESLPTRHYLTPTLPITTKAKCLFRCAMA